VFLLPLIPLYMSTHFDQAFAFVRDFVLGNNTAGLVDSNAASVAGGEDPKLKQDVLPGNSAIYHWASAAGGDIASAVAPSATRAAWDAFIATATAVLPPSGPLSTGSSAGSPSAAVGLRLGEPWPWSLWALFLVGAMCVM
jgi:carboxypeptidase D